MKKKLLLAVFLAVFAACPMQSVQASELPSSSKFDTRIQYVNYNDGDVVVVRALPGTSLRIVFGEQENILDMASGFSSGWELVNRGNILYIKARSVSVGGGGEGASVVKPTARQWDTNLMVRTNKRLYDFDLKLMASRGSTGIVPASSQTAYRIQFRYPQEVDAAIAARDTEKRMGAKFTPLNRSYSMRVGPASSGIAPTQAYDDGRFTYFRFPNNRDFPAVFLLAADKTESLVNSHVEGDRLVVHRVAPTFVLRFGNQIVWIYNDAYDMDGIPPTDGTTVPNVRRTLKKGAPGHVQ